MLLADPCIVFLSMISSIKEGFFSLVLWVIFPIQISAYLISLYYPSVSYLLPGSANNLPNSFSDHFPTSLNDILPSSVIDLLPSVSVIWIQWPFPHFHQGSLCHFINYLLPNPFWYFLPSPICDLIQEIITFPLQLSVFLVLLWMNPLPVRNLLPI